MTILIAPDKFKGSLTARQVCDAITEGIKRSDSSIKVISIPLADGGEGTCDILTSHVNGSKVQVDVEDPLGRPIQSEYGVSSDGKTAFIEMAKASGLQLLSQEDRNPMHTTTFGTGQLILHALQHGAKRIVMGIGGSATNDAGIGMAQALGFRFMSLGEELEPVGKNLARLTSINDDSVNPLVNQCAFTVLCDVKNPLTGKDGAAHVFGSQKGASEKEIELLDNGLGQFQRVAESKFNMDLNFPGAGAAGGMGAGSKVFLNASMIGGFDYVAKFVQLKDAIHKSDLVMTGEGSIDAQSLSGKVVRGVAEMASERGKKCIAFAGRANFAATALDILKLKTVITLRSDEISESEAIEQAYPLLVERAFDYVDYLNRPKTIEGPHF